MAKKHFRSSVIIWVVLIVFFTTFPTSLKSSKLDFFGIFMDKKFSNSKNLENRVFDLTAIEESWVEEKLNQMSTYEKCAQMVMPWVTGDYLAEDSKEYQRIKHLVEDDKVGGLIFFKGNILNEASLINKMQKLSDIPLLISSDFEHGLGMRLIDGLNFPYNMAMAATGDIHLAYEMGKIVSIESRALGVQQNYAPVADVNNNPLNPIINIRSYSENKDIVSKFTSAFIRGESEERVLSTAKHFPGHGNTQIDSHTDMPKIAVDKYNLANIELAPFAASINAGVKSIMIGHLNVPALDPSGVPATLSKRIITELLKNEMGFKGLVVTDAMNMSAITKYYSVAEATVKAVQAGNDMILMPPDEEIAISSIYEAVENNEISIGRINESVKKILTAKKWLHIERNKFSDLENLNKIIGIKSHQKLAREIAVKSITLVKNEDKIIPIDPVKIRRAACISITESDNNESEKIFESEIEGKFTNLQKIFITKKSKKRDYRKAYNIAKHSSLVILPSYVRVKAYEGTVSLSKSNTEFIKKILKLNKPTVVISFGNPYLLSLFPEASTYLCAYGDVPVSQEAMAEAIVGGNKIQGRLPISIPNTDYIVGDGIKVESSTLTYVEGGKDLNYNFAPVELAMNKAIDNKIFPGGVLLIGKEGKVIYEKAFGNFTYEKSSTKMTKDAIFDLGNISEAVATTTAAMLLNNWGVLKLNKKVSDYLPEFENKGKGNIKVKNLLLHNSGLIEDRDFFALLKNKEELLDSIINNRLAYKTESKSVYSPANMIVLKQVVEKTAGENIDNLLDDNIFKPLKMYRTMYNPPRELYYYCPPTSDNYASKKRNKGVAYDGNTFLLNGVSGSSGLFSTAEDLAIFMQMMLQNGAYGDQQYIKSSTVKKWTEVQSLFNSYGLGWNTNLNKKSSAGQMFSENSFGKSSNTGCSVWADKNKNVFVILLTNSIYPDGKNKEFAKFEPELHNKIVQTISENL